MEKKKPDLVVWSEEKGYYSKELTYGSNLGAPAIKLDDIQGWKKDQAMQANKQFATKYGELKEQFEQIIKEVHWNNLVYSSKYSFLPIIGETYHLYEKKDGEMFLSIIEPSSWKQKYIGSFKLDSFKKWIKVE